jgi:serine/threonine protein phosphatase PrpC
VTPASYDVARHSLRGDRPHNQDRCQVLAGNGTLMLTLADGLGGHPRGDAAAQLLVDVAEHLFRAEHKPLADPTRFMLRVVAKAHHSIVQFGQRQRPAIDPRTTGVLAVVQHGWLHAAHVGDSRLYLLRGGRLQARTQDHSVRVERPDGGGRRGSLTRCIGGPGRPPMTSCAPPQRLQTGDVVLLCTDGLWRQAPPARLAQAFAGGVQPIDAQLRALTELARQGGHSDNVSAIALRWRGPGDAAAIPPINAILRRPSIT